MPSRPWRRVSVQDLRQEQALPAYRQTVPLRLEAVENALVTHREARRRFDKLREAKGVERRAVALAHDCYRSGLVDSMGSRRSARSTRCRPSWREASAPSPRISSDCTRR